jgi:2-oxoisovalerate dehydrogenase E1 component
VLFLEHKRLYRQPFARDVFPPADFLIPLGRGDYVQRGDAMTIVSYGYTVHLAREAAARVAEETGRSIEIVDLRCLIPWDQELVAESVARTGRVLVVHEDIKSVGFGGEVAAWIAEHCFEHLDAPVSRVGAQDCHVAYEPTLEQAILPQVDDIAAAARTLLEEAGFEVDVEDLPEEPPSAAAARAGQVWRQSPAAERRLPRGATVELSVNPS